MHPFDFHLLCCIHYAKPRLPPEMREAIFLKTAPSRKWWHQIEQLPPYCGQSKSAAKRRAKRYEKCVKCGNWSHDGKCSKNQTYSQHEYTNLIHVGAIRYKKEFSMMKGSNVYYVVKEELAMLRNKFGKAFIQMNYDAAASSRSYY